MKEGVHFAHLQVEFKVVWQQYLDHSEAVKLLFSISWQNGQKQISWFISDAVNVEMR